MQVAKPTNILKPTVGIIGNGSFGRFAGGKLKPYCAVTIVGRQSTKKAFARAAQSDYVILAVPFGAYTEVLSKLRPLLPTTSVLVDVCSVKTLPLAAIKQAFPTQPLLATHPLFGPQSAAKSLDGHTIIICPQPGNAKLERQAKARLETAGLKVVSISAAKHDRLMADLHALTFFVARVLALYGVGMRDIMTPSYRQLVELANL
jgi:prephenate dehydrogenase